MNINKHIRICTPVVGKTVPIFLNHLAKTQEISSFLELRIDTLEQVTLKDLIAIKQRVKARAIFTCRKKEEGGQFAGSEKERAEILQWAIGRFPFVDIELATVRMFDFSCDEETKIILSYHNITETPSYWDLQKVIFEMNKYRPDILKIATMVQKEYEVTKIYRLLTNKPHDEERIVVGMGEKGRMTRIIGPLLGSYLTYASTEWGDSAPGQIDIGEMEKIYKIIAT